LARDLLVHNRSALDALAEALFTAGYLDRTEITAVLSRAPLRIDVPAATPAPAIANTAAMTAHDEARMSGASGEQTSPPCAPADGAGPAVAAKP
jgi:hypothetical protein